ncbi:ubiquitin carboxy terminal hydrolase Ubp3 [Schizosaccharomyces cryophilus OY26]|uniref:Ubiquitin carboxy terminal hydrolase Ubp3 n=1 Tax=Schizosaccharomyces cryophilus (strain OY26 / ATCC MYA-4695 / CBS 11777 / NBRC 106824 / NRRL Y48691) TaxID=653667 RepID=S9X935_SCHCR|nr:ubiquitin carboxy terminal hydrolase Ubp3 [Schizosaccharomyces cryophilus OY26]EPY53712.1 ubiquitin carboxy terminal hydrolase Ubp3 [Schizosaccharomyces cryophilus OY26]
MDLKMMRQLWNTSVSRLNTPLHTIGVNLLDSRRFIAMANQRNFQSRVLFEYKVQWDLFKESSNGVFHTENMIKTRKDICRRSYVISIYNILIPTFTEDDNSTVVH